MLTISQVSLGRNYEKVMMRGSSPIHSIEKYLVQIDEDIIKPLNVKTLGVGSGLTFRGRMAFTCEGQAELLVFIMLPDRGPIASLPETKDGIPIYMFLSPNYTPVFLTVLVEQGIRAYVEDVTKISYKSGEFARSTPTSIDFDKPHARQVLNVDPELNVLSPHQYGLDAEAIDIDPKRRDLWIAEEYGPSLINLDAQTGQIFKVYRPGRGLPSILKYKQDNRGFESVAVVSTDTSCKVYAVMESVLDLSGLRLKPANTASIVRFIELDADTNKVRMLGYPIDHDMYQDPLDVKISDLAAYSRVSLYHFLVIEQGMGKDGKFKRNIYAIDIEEAQDITSKSYSHNKEIEYVTLDEISNYKLIKKKLLIELGRAGWQFQKMEGLTIISDFMIAIANDNDFDFSEDKGLFDNHLRDNYCTDLDERVIFEKYTNASIPGGILPGGTKGEHNYIWFLKLHIKLSTLFKLWFRPDGLDHKKVILERYDF